MIDGQNRNIDYLRISVTDRCNLRCVYCMPEDGVDDIPHEKILSFDEILRICRIMAENGLKKIKLTGGEPLVRRGIVSLTRQLKEIPGIEEVTMTTNGVLLGDMVEDLIQAGLDSVTVSLDTANREHFAGLTRRDELPRVLESIEAVKRHPKLPLKLNCLLRNVEEDLLGVAAFAKDAPIHVRFIEVMPIGYGQKMEFMNEDDLRRLLERHFGPLTAYHEKLGNGPAVYYSLEGFQGKIGFISAISHKFCTECNRVRLTSDGFLKTCLQYETGVRLKEKLLEGASDAELEQLIEKAIREKPISHQFERKELFQNKEIRTMSQIGG